MLEGRAAGSDWGPKSTELSETLVLKCVPLGAEGGEQELTHTITAGQTAQATVRETQTPAQHGRMRHLVWEGDITKGQIHRSCRQDAKDCKVLLRSPGREAEVCTRLSRTWAPGDPQHEPNWSGFRSQWEGEEQTRQREGG